VWVQEGTCPPEDVVEEAPPAEHELLVEQATSFALGALWFEQITSQAALDAWLSNLDPPADAPVVDFEAHLVLAGRVQASDTCSFEYHGYSVGLVDGVRILEVRASDGSALCDTSCEEARAEVVIVAVPVGAESAVCARRFDFCASSAD
jgi:hypothetical protein